MNSKDTSNRTLIAATGAQTPQSWGKEPTNRSIFHGFWALTNRDLRKWYKVPLLLIFSLIQPVIWLGLYGKAMNFGSFFTSGSFNIPGVNIPKDVLDKISSGFMQNTFGTSDYFSFLAVGMLSFVLLFTVMSSGMSLMMDRRLGVLDKILSTPVSRGTIVMGKVVSVVVRALVQAAVVLVIAVLLGMNVSKITPLGIVGTFAGLSLMSLGFSALFLMLSLRSTNWQSQMMVMNLLNLPLLFGSNALFPEAFMPDWLQYIVKINPISYATDLARQLLLGATGFASLTFDFAYLTGFAVLFSVVGIIMSWKLLSK